MDSKIKENYSELLDTGASYYFARLSEVSLGENGLGFKGRFDFIYESKKHDLNYHFNFDSNENFLTSSDYSDSIWGKALLDDHCVLESRLVDNVVDTVFSNLIQDFNHASS